MLERCFYQFDSLRFWYCRYHDFFGFDALEEFTDCCVLLHKNSFGYWRSVARNFDHAH